MKNKKKIIFLFFMLFFAVNAFTANDFNWFVKKLDSNIIVTAIVPSNYYLYKKFTSVTVKNIDGKKLNAVKFPDSIEHTDDLGKKQFIYSTGIHEWKFKIKKSGIYNINVKYQGCSLIPFACYPPKSFSDILKIENIKNTDQKIFRHTSDANSLLKDDNIPVIKEKNIPTSYLKILITKGSIWIFFASFLGGLLSVFTPCVLPLLPITIVILGAGKTVKTYQAFKRSFLYVMGIVITFTILAIFASVTGRAFGTSLLSNPYILFIFSIFFIIMSFSLLGIFDLQLPNSWNNALNKIGGGTNLGAFMMGLVAGFIAIPCTGPVLATLLGISAVSGNIMFGSLLLMVYALGFALPFFIAGIGLLKMPKSGAYMEIVKSFLGVAILVLAFYILTIVLPSINTFLITPSATHKIIALFLIITGVLIGAFHSDGHSSKKIIQYLKISGAVMLAFGIIWIIKLPVNRTTNILSWYSNIEYSFLLSKENNKPLIMDFTADWCAACKELESITFTNEKIIKELKNKWILVRVDATKDSENLQSVLKKYQINGFPTVIFFSSQGKELVRFSGFVPPKIFLEYINSYKN